MNNKFNIEAIQSFTTIWPLFQKIVKNTHTFIYKPTISETEAEKVWMGPEVYGAIHQKTVIASYRIRPNQLQRGNHIANASFMVDPEWQGKGLGKALGQHAIDRATLLGYKAMQFNMVVSHNHRSLNLWLSLGFHIIGTIPNAYQMPDDTYVDAFIVYKSLQ